MVQIPTDQEFLQKLYSASNVDCYNSDLRYIIESVIRELYYSDKRDLLFQLRTHHIDRAIYKYRIAKENTKIWNTKQYFKSCVVSALLESGLDNLESIEQ